MGMKTAPLRSDLPSQGLASALFSNTQQRVLGLLFGQPGRSFYASELIAQTASGSGAVQRELARLEASGLVNTHRVGNQKHFQANPHSPLFEELCGIARKTMGLAEPLRDALRPLAGDIQAAFVFGSIAKGTDASRSDIDLFILSDSVGYPDVMMALTHVAGGLGREVNPTIYHQDELCAKLKSGNSFVTRVLAQPKIWLIGGEDDLVS